MLGGIKQNLAQVNEGQKGTKMTYDKYRGRFVKVMAQCGLKIYPHCLYDFITKGKFS